MIAADTSSLVAFLSGEKGADVDQLDRALEQKQVVLPPAVVTEILSDASLSKEVTDLLTQIPTLDIKEGYWIRAGQARARVLSKGHKARIADALIAQSCLDHQVPLISRGKDFRHFAKLCALKLL
jgi:predicted nucleic acid-binding protein